MLISPGNTLTDTSRKMYNPVSGCHGPVKLPHKVNHPKSYSPQLQGRVEPLPRGHETPPSTALASGECLVQRELLEGRTEKGGKGVT